MVININIIINFYCTRVLLHSEIALLASLLSLVAFQLAREGAAAPLMRT